MRIHILFYYTYVYERYFHMHVSLFHSLFVFDFIITTTYPRLVLAFLDIGNIEHSV